MSCPESLGATVGGIGEQASEWMEWSASWVQDA